MKKMNKKGFTLIEMLVVIAIIAVLVSIIIPTISSATTKASAATNAANLRAFKAQLVTASLAGTVTSTTNAETGVVTYTDGVNSFTAPTAKAFKFTSGDTTVELTAVVATATKDTNGDNWTVGFMVGEKLYKIDDFAKIAETGKLN